MSLELRLTGPKAPRETSTPGDREPAPLSSGSTNMRSLAFPMGAVPLAHAAEGIILEPLLRLATTLDAFKKLSALAIETASGLEIGT